MDGSRVGTQRTPRRDVVFARRPELFPVPEDGPSFAVAVLGFFGHAAGRPVKATRILITGRPLVPPDALEAELGAPITWNAGDFEIHFPPGTLDLPVVHADPKLKESLEMRGAAGAVADRIGEDPARVHPGARGAPRIGFRIERHEGVGGEGARDERADAAAPARLRIDDVRTGAGGGSPDGGDALAAGPWPHRDGDCAPARLLVPDGLPARSEALDRQDAGRAAQEVAEAQDAVVHPPTT